MSANPVLVAGGDGYLGRCIVKELRRRGQAVRIMSHKPAPALPGNDIEWAPADLITGEGLESALRRVEVVVNCVTSPVENTYETDVAGTRRLLKTAARLGVERTVHVSIIGIDRITHPYYQFKLASELAVVESGIPYTIARGAQFHGFLDYLLSPLRRVDAEEIAIPMQMLFQPISVDDVASHLAPFIVEGGTIGRIPDFGGPEILTLRELTAAWLEIQCLKKKIVPAAGDRTDLPYLGYFGDGFRKGYNTNPQHRIGTVTWIDYLRQTYGR